MRAEIAKVKSSLILKSVAYQSVGLQRGRRNQEDCERRRPRACKADGPGSNQRSYRHALQSKFRNLNIITP